MVVNKKILIVGPTASGKSDLAHRLALALNRSIISADSRQSYLHLDIGTAKPSETHLSQVEYKNISILKPSQKDTPKAFLDRCSHWEETSSEPHIYVGGSTLYQQALLFGFDDIPQQNAENQLYLNGLIQEKGISYLYNWLKEVDPDYLHKMDGMNTQRILRALDVFMQTNKPFSSYHTHNRTPSNEWFVLYPVVETPLLKQRITQRIQKMIQSGLQNEIETVLNMGFSFSDPGLQSIGYQEWEAFFKQQASLEQTIQSINTHSWHYAKRQITWLKRWEFAHKIEFNHNELDKIIQQIIPFLKSN